MCPEYGATVGFFPVDLKTIAYLRQTSKLLSVYFSFKINVTVYSLLLGRSEEKIAYVEAYLKAAGKLRGV